MKQAVAELKAFHASVLGEQLVELETFEDVLHLLESGPCDLPAVVDWGPGSIHSISLKELVEESIHFYNPEQEPDLPVNTVVLENGPVRTVVGSGVESLEVDVFQELFRQGKMVCLTVDSNP